jgi:hypothetical protein
MVPKKEITERWRKLLNENLYIFQCLSDVIRFINSRRKYGEDENEVCTKFCMESLKDKHSLRELAIILKKIMELK